MFLNYTFCSALEQFYILQIKINLINNSIYLLFDNLLLTLLLIFVFFFFSIFSLVPNNSSNFFLIPNRFQFFYETVFSSILSLVQENLPSHQKNNFFPIISTIFFFVFNLNLFGILPYTFTVSSQLIITFTLSLVIFLGIHIIAAMIHKFKLFSLFFPSGVSVILCPLLVPIEFISFIFKPISISVRLFANMMAGHTLLKVIAGFVWGIMSFTGFFSIAHSVPLLLLVILFGLELGVAVIQSFVFTVLFLIYTHDALVMH